MQRIFRALALSTIALALLVPEAVAQTADGQKVNWKLATWGRPRAVTAGMEMLKKHVEEKTCGKFTITIGYESFGGPKELLDLLKVGSLQASHICSSYYPEKLPAYGALDLPFLPIGDLDVQEQVNEAFHKDPYILKELAGWNALPYASNLLPQYEFMGKGKAPKALDDWKGMRVRAIGGLGDAMKKLGSVPTSVDATEVYTSLERGVVDAVSFPGFYAHAAFKVFEVGKWYTENMAPGTLGCPMVLNVEAWQALPDAYKALVTEAKPLVYAALKAAYKEGDDKALVLFRQKGLTALRYSDADLAAFRRAAAEPVWEEWIKQREAQGVPARELLQLLLTAAKSAAKS